MMTSVLPVNALALGGLRLKNWRNCAGKRGNGHDDPHYGHEKSTEGGNYEIPEETYTGNVTIDVTDTKEPVNITIKGNVKCYGF